MGVPSQRSIKLHSKEYYLLQSKRLATLSKPKRFNSYHFKFPKKTNTIEHFFSLYQRKRIIAFLTLPTTSWVKSVDRFTPIIYPKTNILSIIQVKEINVEIASCIRALDSRHSFSTECIGKQSRSGTHSLVTHSLVTHS